jgi:Fe-S cluster assembly ATP-binding protein
MLTIHDLHVSIQGRPILQGIDLAVKPGEVHAIMGPNGSGKSTLAQVLGGPFWLRGHPRRGDLS